jgi:hypothetical protein
MLSMCHSQTLGSRATRSPHSLPRGNLRILAFSAASERFFKHGFISAPVWSTFHAGSLPKNGPPRLRTETTARR